MRGMSRLYMPEKYLTTDQELNGKTPKIRGETKRQVSICYN